jgi:hypothetical protein
VTSELLGVALRAQVQKGDIKTAKETMNLMESLAGEDGDIGAGLTNVLRELVDDLKGQVRDLKASGDTKKLKQVVGHFSDFLNDLAVKIHKKGATIGDITFLAGSFASLEQYEKAADQFSKVAPPALLNRKDPKAKFLDAEELELYSYWGIQIKYAETLRLQARVAPPGKKELDKANEILETLLTHPHGRMHLMARKEKMHVYEDSALYGLALKGFKEVLDDRFLKDNLAQDQKFGLLLGRKPREIYFETYFHYGYCIYKLAQSDVGKKAGVTAKYTEVAAKHFLRLKNAGSPEGWQIVEPRFNEFRTAEAPFREAFDALEKAEKKDEKK